MVGVTEEVNKQILSYYLSSLCNIVTEVPWMKLENANTQYGALIEDAPGEHIFYKL